MAALKNHLLREVAISLCARQQNSTGWRPVAALPGIEAFVLAGKEPFRILRRIVEDDITFTSVGPRDIAVKYQDNRWLLERTFLCTLFAQWTRRIRMDSFRLCYRAGRGFAKTLMANRYIGELRIDKTMFNKLSVIQKAFPELTTLGIPAYQLSEMLENKPMEPNFLNKLVLTRLGYDKEDDFLDAHEALAAHQTKWSFLETLRYADPPLKKFCDLESTISIVKHIEIETFQLMRMNFFYLADVQRLFPSLESVEIVYRGNYYHDVRQLENIYQDYETFESLNFAFFLKVTNRCDIKIPQRAVDRLHQFLCTKGKVYKTPSKLIVKTVVPGKELIYEFKIRVVERAYIMISL